MKIFNTVNKLWQILNLKVKTIGLGNSSKAIEFYTIFNKRHPKCPLFKRKVLGVALVSFADYNKDFAKYYKSINGKNSAAYYSRKAAGRGYVFKKINPNDYIDDIYEINISKDERQGQRMAGSYCTKKEHYDTEDRMNTYGVVSSSGKLVSYAWVYKLGELSIINTLLGHGDLLNDGIMYLMVLEVVKEMMAEQEINYVMYDMYFGASSGLKMFKDKLGFRPYKVKWVMENKVGC